MFSFFTKKHILLTLIRLHALAARKKQYFCT